jgi:hypothetical protein
MLKVLGPGGREREHEQNHAPAEAGVRVQSAEESLASLKSALREANNLFLTSKCIVDDARAQTALP